MPAAKRGDLPIGKVLLSVVAAAAPAGALVADWNETHVHNPRWPPHAKFHNAQTIVTAAELAGLAGWQLWGRRPWSRSALRQATLLSSLYWLTQAPAALFPGTALADPEFADRQRRVAGVPLNQLTAQVAVLYPLILAGYWWESRRLRQQPGGLPCARRSPVADRHRRDQRRHRRQA